MQNLIKKNEEHKKKKSFMQKKLKYNILSIRVMITDQRALCFSLLLFFQIIFGEEKTTFKS